MSEGLYAMQSKPVPMQVVLRAVDRALKRRPLLVVDDAEPYLKSLADSLRALGMVVETVPNGARAVDYAQNHGVDACILDVTLLPSRGMDVCQTLSKVNRQMDIIGIIGENDFDLARGIACEGVSVWVHKPFEMNALLFALVKARSNGLPAQG